MTWFSRAKRADAPLISVIIPTYDRPHELRLCLEGFARQTAPREQFEVVVIDDGSPADLSAVSADYKSAIDLHWQRIANGGPSTARNAGIQQARAPLVILYDDDLRPLPDLVEYCIDFHRGHPDDEDAALLHFGPDRSIAADAAVRWAFPKLYPFPAAASLHDWRGFWSGTVTCKKSLFRLGAFDPAYRALEDAELGLRIARRVGDLRIHFDARLKGTLIRKLTFPQICRRQYATAYHSYILARNYRGAVGYDFPPYDAPESYIIGDRRKLEAMASTMRGLQMNGAATPHGFQMLCALWSRAEIHVRASGWMAARDGLPAEPNASLAPFVEI